MSQQTKPEAYAPLWPTVNLGAIKAAARIDPEADPLLMLSSPEALEMAALDVIRFAKAREVSLEAAWAAFLLVALGVDENRKLTQRAGKSEAHFVAYLVLVLDAARRLLPCQN